MYSLGNFQIVSQNTFDFTLRLGPRIEALEKCLNLITSPFHFTVVNILNLQGTFYKAILSACATTAIFTRPLASLEYFVRSLL